MAVNWYAGPKHTLSRENDQRHLHRKWNIIWKLATIQSSSFLLLSTRANFLLYCFFLIFPLTTLISFPFFQSFPASAPFSASNLAWQFLAMVAFTLVRVWSVDFLVILVVRLAPGRHSPPSWSRPPPGWSWWWSPRTIFWECLVTRTRWSIID